MQVNLAHHAPISRWKPEVGDFIVWHGFFTHWFGVVCEVKADEVTVIKAGMPLLLFSMSQSEYDKNKESIGIGMIQSGGSFWHGKYAAIKSMQNTTVWFV